MFATDFTFDNRDQKALVVKVEALDPMEKLDPPATQDQLVQMVNLVKMDPKVTMVKKD